MVWTTPRLWTTAELVTAAIMNTHVRDNLRYLKGLDGSVAIDSAVAVTGAITASTSVTAGTYVSAGTVLSAAAGDLNANRGGGTGYVVLGVATRYLGYDGTNYVLNGAELLVNGVQAATTTNTLTLSNKTLATPVLTSILTATTSGGSALPTPIAGTFRLYKAYGGSLVLTASSIIGPGATGATSSITLLNGESALMIADGTNWWVI